ncbi:MAG: tetratricopeptide repeat protein, partial [Bradymonadaceae bacterium]
MEFYRHWLGGEQTDPALYRLMGDAYMKLAPQRWSRRRYPGTSRDDATNHARRYYRRYLEEADPSRTELEEFANSMRQSDMWSTAADAYGRIIGSTSSGSKLRPHHAEALLHLGEADRAMELYREYYEARGKSPDDARKIANRLFEFRYLERAEPYLDRMFSSDNGDHVQAAFVKLAETYQHTGRTERISSLVTDFLNRAPNPAKARQLAVQVLKRRGLYEEAAAQIARVREFQGNVMGFDLGANLFRAGQTEQARKAFRRHADESPYPGAVWLKIADFYEAHARPEMAREAYNKAVEAAPDDFKPREARGRFRLLQGEIEAGMADFQHALDRASAKHRDAVRKTQVETLKSMGYFARAADIARQTLSSANRHRGFFLRTTAEHALKIADKSRVNRIIQQLSSSSIALEDVVEMVVNTGHRKAAADLIRDELDSGNFSAAGRAMVKRPDVFTRLGGIDALKRAARPLLKQGDAQSTLRAQIGEYFIRQGRFQEGIVYLRSAAEDGRPLFRTVLAQTYAQLGRTDQAVDLFQDHLADVSQSQQRQVLRRVGIRLELSGHPGTFENLLRNLVHDDDYAAAATGLLVELMARRGEVDDALGTVRRINDSVATDATGESGRKMLIDDTDAVDRILAGLKGLAAAGYQQEADQLLEQLPAAFRDHPGLEKFDFYLSAAIGGDQLGNHVDRAMAALNKNDTRSARDRRMAYARVLHRNGHFDLAARMVAPAVQSPDHKSVESATRFLIRNAYSRGKGHRIDKVAGRYRRAMSDELRVLSNVGNTLHDLGRDAQSLERLAPVARRASTSDNVRRALDVAQAAGDTKATSRLLETYLRVAERPLSDMSDMHKRAIIRQDPEIADRIQTPYERTYPHRLEVRLRRARLAFRTGNVQRGRETLRNYLKDVDYGPAAVERVLEFLDTNNLWAEQTTLVLDQVDTDSLTHRSLRHLGFAFANLRRPDRARSFFDRAIDNAPDGAEMATNLTRSLFEEGHTKLATTYGNRAVELRPARPAGRLYRGMARLAAGDSKAAEEDLKVGLDAGINRLYSLFQVGKAALEADRPELAEKYLMELSRTPNSSDYGILMPTRLAIDAYRETDRARDGVQFLETHF